MTKIYVIEGTKEVLKKSRTHSAYKKGMKKIIKFLNNFFNMNYILNTHHIFLYHAYIRSYYIYFFENYRRGTSWLIKIKTSFAPTMYGILLGTKVNNMASRVKGLVCLWHHEHGRTYRSHDFNGGGRSRVLVS